MDEKNCSSIVIKTNHTLIQLRYNEITHIESSGSYSLIYTLLFVRPVLVTKSIKVLENILANQDFFRYHHSHIVNLTHVLMIDLIKREIKLKTNQTVPISRRKFTKFKNTFTNYNLNLIHES